MASSETPHQSETIFGAIARVSPIQPHENFIEAAEPAWVSVKLDRLKTLVNRGETEASWGPARTRVISTSTIHDDKLDGFPLSHEAKLIDAFEPSFHIGGDLSVYNRFPPHRRAELIKEYMKNAIWLTAHVTNGTTIVPIIKGFTPDERELCYRGLEYFDHDYVAYYLSQTHNSGKYKFQHEKEVLQEIGAKTDSKIILLGSLNDSIAGFPDSVVAAAGFGRWYNKTDPKTSSEKDMQRAWEEIEATVADNLST
jgi:hypothetical protein